MTKSGVPRLFEVTRTLTSLTYLTPTRQKQSQQLIKLSRAEASHWSGAFTSFWPRGMKACRGDRDSRTHSGESSDPFSVCQVKKILPLIHLLQHIRPHCEISWINGASLALTNAGSQTPNDFYVGRLVCLFTCYMSHFPSNGHHFSSANTYWR